jgi:hypothetical protein
MVTKSDVWHIDFVLAVDAVGERDNRKFIFWRRCDYDLVRHSVSLLNTE